VDAPVDLDAFLRKPCTLAGGAFAGGADFGDAFLPRYSLDLL
jgi:hypothetical protein